jgi:hypothetical protein
MTVSRSTAYQQALRAAQDQALRAEHQRAAEAVFDGTASLAQYAWQLAPGLAETRGQLLPGCRRRRPANV